MSEETLKISQLVCTGNSNSNVVSNLGQSNPAPSLIWPSPIVFVPNVLPKTTNILPAVNPSSRNIFSKFLTTGVFKVRKKKTFSCNYCNYECFARTTLQRHVQSHSKKKKPFTCNLCCKELRSNLLGHLETHTDVTPFSCHYCNLKYSTNNRLRIHLKRHKDVLNSSHSEENHGTIKEEIISEEFQILPSNCIKTEPKINEQENLENKQEIFEKFQFVDINNVKTEPKIKEEVFMNNENYKDLAKNLGEGKKLFMCDICNYKTFFCFEFCRHLQTHTGLNPFACDFCEFKCAYKTNLANHIKTHNENEKKYLCQVCNKQFTLKHSFEKHLASHKSKIWFPLEVYGLKFSQNVERMKHSENNFNNEPVIGDSKIVRRCYLKNHSKTLEIEKFKCDDCNLTFLRKYLLKNHLKIHKSVIIPVVCNICNLKFAKEEYLTVHLKTHANKKLFVCKNCDCKFSKKKNMVEHLKTNKLCKDFIDLDKNVKLI